MRMKLLLVLNVLLIVGYVAAEINQRTSAQSLDESKDDDDSNMSSMDKWKRDCTKSYSAMCLKLDVVSFVDRLSERDSIGILPGVSVVKQNSTTAAADVVANLARDFPNDVDKRMDAYLMHKVGSYLNSHAISIRLFDPRTFEATRSFNEAAMDQLGLGEKRDDVESGRGKNKGGGMGGMMAAAMMMKGTLGALGFGALAMLAGKALMTGLLALMLSAIIGLKSLAGGGEKKTTYEIVAKPVHSVSHSHSSEEHGGSHGGYSGGYARSLDLVRDAIEQYGNARQRRSY